MASHPVHLPLAASATNGCVSLARHGYGHTIPPHEVNYRANLWALYSLNLTRVIAVASVGGIRVDLSPGTLAIPDQIIDYTYGRKYTFYEGVDRPVTHIDFTEPYCQLSRQRLLEAARRAHERVIDGGVYGATQGPRLETAAEIARLERDGVDMVGMTGMPEAALAKELGLCYATIAVVANHAAGRATSVHVSGWKMRMLFCRRRWFESGRYWNAWWSSMPIKPVLTNGRPPLARGRQESAGYPALPEFEALMVDMHDTMEAPDGAGLAAPQIGVGLQVVIFGVKRNPRYPRLRRFPIPCC